VPLQNPRGGGATKKKADFTTQHALIGFKHPHLPQSSALHNRTCPCPLTSDRTRNARAPTSPRSIGFCAIWESISSSSSSTRIRFSCGFLPLPEPHRGLVFGNVPRGTWVGAAWPDKFPVTAIAARQRLYFTGGQGKLGHGHVVVRQCPARCQPVR